MASITTFLTISPVAYLHLIFVFMHGMSLVNNQKFSCHPSAALHCWNDSTISVNLDRNGFGWPPPDHPGDGNKYVKHQLWATQYYVYQAPYSGTGVSLLNLQGKPTGVKLELCDWCGAAIEGTVYTTDSLGRPVTLNVGGKSSASQVDCSLCMKYEKYKNLGIRNALWYVARGKYGDGVNSYSLVPYRSIAVDKTNIPIGSVLFIPAACGVPVTFPDGSISVHDGYFFAADVGSDIRENHIDVFTGTNRNAVFPFVTSRSDAPFTAYRVIHPELSDALKQQHRPG